MKRISTPLEPAPFNLCSDGYTALALAIYGDNSYLSPQEAAKTMQVCKTFKEIGETSDQALNYWKWHTSDLFDVNEKENVSTTKVWKDLFFSKADEILKTLQNRILDEEIYECQSDIDLEEYENFINFIKPIEKYSLKANANKSLQLVIAEFYKSAWYCLAKDGIDYERDMAMRYFKLSADQGDSEAQLKLGLTYYEYENDGDLEHYRANGIPDEKYFDDLKRAFEYFEKAAYHGNLDALEQITFSYEDGKRFLQNPESIFNCFKNKTTSGSGEYYFYAVASCYELGIGVKKNMSEAIKYYKVAAARCFYDSLSKVELLCNIDPEIIANFRILYFNYMHPSMYRNLTPEAFNKVALFSEFLGTEFSLQLAKIAFTKAINYYKTIISSPLLHTKTLHENVPVITDVTDTWYASKEEELLEKAVWYEKEQNLNEACKYYKLAAELLVNGK